MKVAVTGATGFIGQHVVKSLQKFPVEIVAAVRNGSSDKAKSLGVTTVEFDLAASTDSAYAQLGFPDTLIHLAWAGLPNYKSLHHFEQELPRHYTFLQRLVQSGLTHLVVTGTCFEYGMQSGLLHESLPPLPSNPYGFAKNSLRVQLEFLQAQTPFALTWARLFYLYGEGQAPNSLFPQLQQAVQRGDNSFNMSGGEQLRDYLSITEIAEGLVNLALSKTGHNVINICSGKPVSVRRLVENWIKTNNWKIDLNLGYYPYPEYEPFAFWGDRTKFSNALGL
ncbi:MAG: NAD(P)-dependent oxidoreductase [Cyanobacteria bacterium P01_H01_bin.15]